MLAPSLQVSQRPYLPRTPASGLFHRLVREHLATLRELRPELPRHVVEAFEGFLECGILAHGFARLRCVDCGHERLLPFSCKGRLCPSCNGRRMYDTAAHLVDRVLPLAGHRQWVLSLPRRVRYLLVTRPELVTPVLGVFQRVLFAWQRRRGRRNGVARPLAGSITCIQRFGDALNLNLHFHSFLPDGVFSRESDDAPVVFVPLAPPTHAELDILVERLCRRIGKKLAALGAWEPQVEDGVDPERAELGRSIGEQLVAFNPDDEAAFERKGLSAFRLGYSLHAGVAVAAEDRAGLERILRYGLRPPFAEHRLEEDSYGEVYYRLRKPLRDGRSQLRLDPVDLLRRLAAFVPPKGQNLVRYHGVFAPNSKHREAVVRLPARAATHTDPEVRRCGSGEDAEGSTSRRTGGQPGEPPCEARPRRIPWADLLKRVFEYDLTTCPACGGGAEVVAVIVESAVVRRILDHLGLPTAPPRRGLAHARAPPSGPDGDGPTVDELLTDELP